ncbi:MAG: putative selenate reductase subunit YgfK [Bacteroidales bacterium]|nr:putative selenate reductase subunit YgfK [Bacteroidales bacterium]MCF8404713.1 putative selenate reductase subunit YgfK [Bacteroidales bacterium]
MTDKFSIIPFRQLTKLILDQIDSKHQYFGIPEEVFFKPDRADPFRKQRFGQILETPIGVAAGPHTQMTQNIVAAWLCGARYLELKTIQTLDELNVAKPCIDMQDEGYNCEWSQELKIHESYDQYLNAWILIHLLKHKIGFKDEELGTIFNMSIGYDLQGILKENVQRFLNKMKNCSIEKKSKIEEIRDIYPAIREITIPDCISNNVTLSTMHGCPPDEIEKIGLYLIEEKKLHTTIKLNPTLLGKKKLHKILAQSGFKSQVPDEAFEHDLKYPDALLIIKNLQKAALKNNVHFGLKLTNTLESQNHKSIFPKSEKMMYLSGRALHPLAINLAYKLQLDFNGMLDISFSGGANGFNVHSLIACGLHPITVCSDILKPGGYGLLNQYLNNLKSEFHKQKSGSIDDFIFKISDLKSKEKAILKNLEVYSREVIKNKDYKKRHFQEPSIKTSRKLTAFDCIAAPCSHTCPTNQDIPDYLHFVADNEDLNSFRAILRTNPFPNSTGMVCDHLCQTKCTRINYDDPLLIRDIKRYVAEKELDVDLKKLKKKSNGKKVAIIGAGPSGLSAGYFLVLAGFQVDVYENKEQTGGMVSGAIPSFRLTNAMYLKDLERIQKTGIKIHYNSTVSKLNFGDIRLNYDFVYVATGSPRTRKFKIEGIEAEGVIDPLYFLLKVKEGRKIKLGKNIIIVGGGNTAMDAARTAFRLAEKDAKITILYRRTMGQMPADQGEIKAALDEGIEIHELVLPIKVNTVNNMIKNLSCLRMKLKGLDAGGRPKPVEIPGSEFEISCDTLIPAIGQDPDIDFIEPKFLYTEPGIYETKIPNIFIGGDALRGPSTAIHAIGDGRKAAEKIMKKAGIDFDILLPKGRKKLDPRQLMIHRMTKNRAVQVKETSLKDRRNFHLVTQTLSDKQAKIEAARCLKCDELCNTCVTVCPNLALYSYFIKPEEIKLSRLINSNGKTVIVPDDKFIISQSPQILHIADWCNECGNCSTFCPTSGAPYKEKPHIYLNKVAFDKDDNCYFLDGETLLYRKDEQVFGFKENNKNYEYYSENMVVQLSKVDFSILDLKVEGDIEVDLRDAAKMKIILPTAQNLLGIKNSPFLKGAGGIHKTPYLPYDKNLKKYSRNLRNDSTLGEVLLWKELRAKKLGYTFNRQKPILKYIVDFYCKPLNLILEVDGESHDNDDARRRDIKRQRELEALGLIFLRFNDREVKKDIENVIQKIKTKIKEIEKGYSS